MTTAFKKLWASQVSSIIHKEKIMFCHHRKMCPKSRLAFFHRHVWKGTALHCVLSGVPALQRLLEHCWWPSIHNARDNFSRALFLVLCSLTYDLRAHRDVAVIASLGSPTLAETKLRGAPKSQQTHTLHLEGLSTIHTSNQNKAAIKEKDHFQNAKGCFRRVQSEEKIERMTTPKARQAWEPH